MSLTGACRIACGIVCFAMGLESAAWAGSIFIPIDVPGASRTIASDINDGGQIVGMFGNGSDSHGFVYQNGAFTTMDAPNLLGDGFNRTVYTEASGINDRGTIVGAFQTFAGLGEPVNGFVDTRGRFSVFGSNGPIRGSAVPLDINNAGHSVGYLYFAGGYDGFLRDRKGLISPIQVPGAGSTIAQGINNRGDIVGGFGLSRFDDPSLHGFLLDRNGRFTTLDAPGAIRTTAFGINDHGQIVGSFVDVSGGTHGFLATDGIFTTIDAPGASSTAILGINNAGLFVGQYTDGTGQIRGFLDPPSEAPEPASLLLLASGIGVLTIIRKHWN